MMGSFLTRALLLALGYAYPAYECFKTVEKNKPEIEQLRFWCQYWILVAVLTVFERVGDTFVSWVPMYSEAKLAFFVYLWYPKTRGTTYVYDTFLRPYVAKHETEIDRNILELRARAGDIVVLYWQKAATYGQTRFLEILQYVAAQSQTSRPRPVQQRRQQVHQAVSTTPGGQPAAAQQPQLPFTPRNPVKNPVHDSKQEGVPVLVSPPVLSDAPASLSQPSTGATSHSAASSETEPMEVEVTKVSTNANLNTPQETVVEETIRLTRARLRKARAATTAPHTTATTTTATTTATSAGATNH